MLALLDNFYDFIANYKQIDSDRAKICKRHVNKPFIMLIQRVTPKTWRKNERKRQTERSGRDDKNLIIKISSVGSTANNVCVCVCADLYVWHFSEPHEQHHTHTAHHKHVQRVWTFQTPRIKKLKLSSKVKTVAAAKQQARQNQATRGHANIRALTAAHQQP